MEILIILEDKRFGYLLQIFKLEFLWILILIDLVYWLLELMALSMEDEPVNS
jgi:hypothetical protein